MENNSFHSQLLSVMDVLAKAAVAEINRRVEDSCAVLRVEVSQSRRDIALLRRKCEVMETELRRTRIRARRKVFCPPAPDRFSSLVKVVLNKEIQTTDWDGQTEAEAQSQPEQCAETQPADEAENLLIKVECSEEEMWKNPSEDKMKSEENQATCFEASQPPQTEGFAESHHSGENEEDSLMSTGGYTDFQDQNEAELLVKHEKEDELHESSAPLNSVGNFVSGEGQLWASDQWTEAADPSSSYVGQQFPAVFPSQGGLHFADLVPQIQSIEKSQSVVVSEEGLKRRLGTVRSKRQIQIDGINTSSQFNTMGQSSVSQQSQHPYRHQDVTLTSQIPLSTTFHGHSRMSSVLARRIKTAWRSSTKEKKFCCSYCSRSFHKCCQLKEHLRSHTGERPFSCKLCGRSFAKQCNLIRHAVVHSGERPHECSLCGKCFSQRSSLKSHQKTAH
ncbi:zinc finger and SCAN domain-containing protein 2 [Cheilinus undulatus]|uniref:zinc finger and SCAN domain-containing protein 2 n=1 Tax=Cheilinus undulatus TaxID=241271 RepID=UPI001BD4B7FF|nr:zinc finger and SCAN domain-containing protein 2 [Cheilinus undulatus]